MCKIVHFQHYGSEIKFSTTDSGSIFTSIEVNGIEYKEGMFLLLDSNKMENEFGRISKISKVNGRIIFSIESFEELIFDSNYNAFEVHKTNNGRSIFFDCIPYFPPLTHTVKNGRQYLIAKYCIYCKYSVKIDIALRFYLKKM